MSDLDERNLVTVLDGLQESNAHHDEAHRFYSKAIVSIDKTNMKKNKRSFIFILLMGACFRMSTLKM